MKEPEIFKSHAHLFSPLLEQSPWRCSKLSPFELHTRPNFRLFGNTALLSPNCSLVLEGLCCVFVATKVKMRQNFAPIFLYNFCFYIYNANMPSCREKMKESEIFKSPAHLFGPLLEHSPWRCFKIVPF
jgi:hypothetical protein